MSRLTRHGSTVQVVEFRCPRCRRGLLLTKAEAENHPPGMVPYCQDCLKDGVACQMTQRFFRSGGPDLRV